MVEMLINKVRFFLRKLVFKCGLEILPRFKSNVNANFGISTVIHHKAVDMSIYSIRSFFYQTGFWVPVFAVNDGSLTEEDKIKLHKNFNLNLIENDSATARMEILLKKYPNFKKYRLSEESQCTKFKFDAILLSPFKRLIFLDNDVLFHNPPKELIDWVKSHGNKFLGAAHDREYLGSNTREDIDYCFRQMVNNYKFKLLHLNFNSGILAVPDKRIIDLDKLDTILRFFDKLGYTKTFFTEETSMAILFKTLGAEILSPRKYVCPVTDSEYGRAFDNQVTAAHYIGESKKFFERDAAKMFLRAIVSGNRREFFPNSETRS
jgi:hypothetical protein